MIEEKKTFLVNGKLKWAKILNVHFFSEAMATSYISSPPSVPPSTESAENAGNNGGGNGGDQGMNLAAPVSQGYSTGALQREQPVFQLIAKLFNFQKKK